MPWRRKWQPTLVFLPGESHGLRSLVGYSPQGSKELDRTERLHFHFHGMMILPYSSWCPALHMCLLLSPIPHEELQAALLIPSFSPVPMATPSINAEMWLQGWVVFRFFFFWKLFEMNCWCCSFCTSFILCRIHSRDLPAWVQSGSLRHTIHKLTYAFLVIKPAI